MKKNILKVFLCLEIDLQFIVCSRIDVIKQWFSTCGLRTPSDTKVISRGMQDWSLMQYWLIFALKNHSGVRNVRFLFVWYVSTKRLGTAVIKQLPGSISFHFFKKKKILKKNIEEKCLQICSKPCVSLTIFCG